MSSIKVAVRVRPISEREINFTGSEIVVHTEAKAISLTNLKVSSSKAGDSRERTRRYGFDYCFDSSVPGDEKYASQSMIYETLGESILDVLFKGYNSCLVAYGQSASGKTYTMMGSKEDPGLTPRVCEGLFLRLANEEKSNTKYDVTVSYLEVYNERVRDLLRPSSSSIGLKVREHPRLGPYVQGLTHHSVFTLGSLISRVEEGTRARKTASTLQNPTSSRSHALLTLSLLPSTSDIGQSAKDDATVTSGNVSRKKDHFPGGSKLHLVDLAGSESAAACGGINRLKEGANINKSLVALGNVISALAERGSTGSGPGRRFIPYRDSALTWLLKDALGGNATTVMLATISPASGSYNETSHTLRFAQRAQSVVNRPVINEDPVSRIIRDLRAEVARLKSLLVEKNVNPDCKSICACQHDREQDIKSENHENQGTERDVAEEEKPEDEEDYEVTIEERNLRIPERRHSTSESFLSRKKLSTPVRRFGSFEIVRESKNSSLDQIEADNYKRAKVSNLIIDDEVDEPAFVDIPTLVAVLIKPDDNIQVEPHQIEEISCDGLPEDPAHVELSVNVDSRISSRNNEYENIHDNVTRVEDIASSEILNDLKFTQKVSASFGESSIIQRAKGNLRKHDSIDDDFSPKSSLNLQVSKRYGSIESLPKKREATCPFQRTQTNLEKRNGSLEKIKKLNNIKEIDDRRTSKTSNSWRNSGSWPSRDFQRKGSNDSDKSLRDSALIGKSKNQGRRQSIDGIKLKTSKDSSTSSSKDELLTSVGGQTRERFSRKGSLENEQFPARAHTPIQRARRADIVAAVTERLYSSKRLSDENALTGTTASTPGSEVRSPESTDVKLASVTRMRLQEISRKMLAKRRKICVDTQTDNNQTVRVRDASCITEETKIISKDAAILTDRHEDYETLEFVEFPVRRVKEISTCIDSDLRKPIIHCKDAANLTEAYYDDYGTLNSPRNDSGIMSDDTQTYAESNLSSTEISDHSPIGGARSVELVENSTNTRIPSVLPNSGSQTMRDDFARLRCSNYDARCCAEMRHCRGNYGLERSPNDQTCHHTDRNVISISLPEQVSITIETSNVTESKIRVFDGNESTDERAIVSLRDNTAQTEKRKTMEIGTLTDDISGQVYFRDFSTSTRQIIGQADGKTFRIENIFCEPRGTTRNASRIEIIGNSSDDAAATNSLMVTKSIGTSFVPETRENATDTDVGRTYCSGMFLGVTARGRTLTNDEFVKNTWPLRCRARNSNSRQLIDCQDYSMLMENSRLLSNISIDNLNVKYDTENSACQKEEDESRLELDKKVLDEQCSRKDSTSKTKRELSKTSREDTSVTGLKSSSIVATLNRKVCTEQDSNFSDDSLDLTEDAVLNDRENVKPVMKSSKNKVNLAETTTNEKACPPDLVAHTKKDINDSTISADNSLNSFEDFDDESQEIEFPKMKINGTTVSSFATPLSNFKNLILGDPCYTVSSAEESNFNDFDNYSSTDTLNDNVNYRSSTIDIVEDMKQCLANGGRLIPPKSIMKKVSRRSNDSRPTDKCQSNSATKNFSSENYCAKSVRFAIPEVYRTTSSDSEACENLTSEEENFGEKEPQRKILKDYLDEAVVFMRNMNSMNEYMSAAWGSKKCKFNGRNRRRVRAKSTNYIEYEGRRISLEDDNDKFVGSDDNDDDDDDNLKFNVESYDKCLRSIDRLEECLVRVKQHDEKLCDKYGIGKDGSTGARLDLAEFSIDSNDSNKDLNDANKYYDTCLRRNSNGNSVTVNNDEIDDGNNNSRLGKNDDEYLSSESILANLENLKKPRARRFSRFSELRKSNPTTYSQLRSRYASRAVEARTRKNEDISCSGENVKSLKDDETKDTIIPEDLRTPDCCLVLPETTRKNEGPSIGFKSCTLRQRFSLSKYDSSNDSSSSNETLASFMESIDSVGRTRDKFKYPCSPRAKFLQLLNERRRIVENTRSTGAS